MAEEEENSPVLRMRRCPWGRLLSRTVSQMWEVVCGTVCFGQSDLHRRWWFSSVFLFGMWEAGGGRTPPRGRKDIQREV